MTDCWPFAAIEIRPWACDDRGFADVRLGREARDPDADARGDTDVGADRERGRDLELAVAVRRRDVDRLCAAAPVASAAQLASVKLQSMWAPSPM